MGQKNNFRQPGCNGLYHRHNAYEARP